MTLYAACREVDDDLRWIAALLIDTGARLAEVVGLPLADIDLDDAVPHGRGA
jgi:integrase